MIKIGTRGSALARTQTGHVAESLGVPNEIVRVVTEGDVSTASVSSFGGTGVFVSALREALQRGEIDIAVHSFKDLPTAPYPGLTVAAVPTREDPRDALVARDGLTLGELPPGSKVGTGSLRRGAQIAALGLGVEVVGLRGNVDTRLGKVTSGELDAVVVAYAGLRRLGRHAEATEILDPIQVLPAPAQGALAVECRADDEDVLAVLKPLDDLDTRAAVTAERALLAALEAGCSAPVGALAEVVSVDETTTELFLRANVTALDGSDAVRLSATGVTNDAEGVGRRLAAELLADGASELMGRPT